MNLLDYFIIKKITPQQVQVMPSEPDFDPNRLGPKTVHLSWVAAGRAIKKLNSDKLTRSMAVIGVIVALFLVIVQEYMLILVVASMVFVTQVLAKTPPEDVSYELSNYGLSIDGQIYYWHQLRRFFFQNTEGQLSLIVDLVSGVSSRLFISFNPKDQAKIKEVMFEKLQYLESPPESFLDRTYKSVTNQFTAQS